MARPSSNTRKNSTAAMVIAGRLVRACDVSIKDPAHWYCPNDDVHLCERCDAQVYDSKCLSRRHGRFRLDDTMAVKLEADLPENGISTNLRQCRNSRKRPRTSWGKPHANYAPLCKVIKQEYDLLVEDGDMLRQVPAIFDRWGLSMENEAFRRVPSFPSMQLLHSSSSIHLGNFTPTKAVSSDIDVTSFVVAEDFCDVDRFLGQRFCELERGIRSIMGEAVDIASGSIVPNMEIDDDNDNISKDLSLDTSVELSEEDYRIDLSDFEPAEGSLDADWQMKVEPSRRLFLRLNYEDVLNAWSDRGPLWTDGMRPQIVPDDCELDFSSGMDYTIVPDMGSIVPELGEGCSTEDGQSVMEECVNESAGREARVLRYKEKRRTRRFSKKIRYEVRKLNAERRPRMKGRFIKRSLSC